MTSPLVPCPVCSRHVQITERTCRFCESTLPSLDVMKARVVPANPGLRLDRFALFTFATAFSVAACSTGGGGLIDDSDGGNATDGGTRGDGSVKDDGGLQAAYGIPIDAMAPRDSGNGFDANCCPPYGVPPPFDAGPPPDDGGTD